MASITTFDVGFCTHRGCMALRGATLHVCPFPNRVWLIEVDERRWLWDTGYASHFEDATRTGIFSIYRRVTPVFLEETQSLRHQLARAGLDEGDFEALICSHFHADHIAGLRDFGRVPLVCSGEGWRALRSLRGFAALRRAFVPGLIPDDFEERVTFVEAFDSRALPPELAPFERGYHLPRSDGQVFLVPLPGHAAGHLGAFVREESGWTLLASDAAWSPTSYREQRGPSRVSHIIMDDPGRYYQTLAQLHELWRGGRVQIRLCHEGAL